MARNDGSVVEIHQGSIGEIEAAVTAAIKQLKSMHETNQKTVATLTNGWITSESEGAIAYRQRDQKIVGFIDEVHTAAQAFAARVAAAGQDAVATDGKIANSYG